MNKIVQFGRKFMFYARVLSGYEERRIRALRLEMEKRIQQAEERKMALTKLPEQTILSEVRRMVEDMQNLNKKLEETEIAIEEHFKPLDKQAERMVKMQLEGREESMKQMVETMQQQVLRETAEAEKLAVARAQEEALAKYVQTDEKNQDPRPNTQHLPPPL